MKKPLDLSAFGLEADLDENDQILDVMVLLRNINPECGRDGIYISVTPGMSWLMQLGMAESASSILKAGIYRANHDFGEDE